MQYLGGKGKSCCLQQNSDSKIVIDAMNPYSENFELIDLGNSNSSEEVLKQIPSSRLVKAFNTIYYEHLSTKGNPNAPKEDRFAIFVAGDDFDAKAIVSKLIEDIGFAPIDTGSLRVVVSNNLILQSIIIQ